MKMNKNTKPLFMTKEEIKVYEEIEKVFSADSFSYETDVPLRTDRLSFGRVVDAIIFKDNDPIIVVEVNSGMTTLAEERLRSYMLACRVTWGILTDSIHYRLLNSDGVKTDLDSLDKVKEVFAHRHNEENIQENKEQILKDIHSFIQLISEKTKKYSNARVKNIISNLAKAKDLITKNENLVISSNGVVSFKDDDTEDMFFKTLFGDVGKVTLCRYTTVNSLYLTIRDAKHNMCNINCMNDKGESSYADEYIKINTLDNKTKRITDSNNSFILSLSEKEKEDNLTMWRLYGDDAKGVCLRYENNENVKGKKHFHKAKVSYALEDGYHPELELVKYLTSEQANSKIWIFDFRRWEIWKHFFKSFNYQDEKEVRLLYIAPKKENDKNIDTVWMQDYKSGIICEMKLFNYEYSENSNSFPLKITHIYLGPKSSEKNVNVEQIAYMLSKSRVYKTEDPYSMVNITKIDDYR